MYSTITAKVVDQTLTVLDVPKIASGGENEIRVEVNFDNMWSGYGKTAIFYRKENQVYHVVMTDGVCVIPREVLTEPGRLYFGVMGASGSSVRTTEVVALNVVQGAITGLSPFEPLPDVYKQLLSAYAEAMNDIAVEKARLDNLIANGGASDDAELVDIRVGADGKTYVSAGEAVRGQFGSVRLAPYYYDFWYLGAEFFAEGDKDFNLYLKFDTLTQRTPTETNRHDWETIISDINEETRFVTSPSGVENCLKLSYYEALVFYPDTNLFAAIKRPLSMSEIDYVNIAFNAWGRLENCLLSDMLAGFYVEDLQKISKHSKTLAALPTGIPDYWESELAAKIQQIQTRQSEGGVGTTSFAFIADVHNGSNMSITSKVLDRVCEACDISVIINGGDMVGGAGKCAKSVTIADLENVKNAFRANSGMFYLEGNHDAAYDTTTTPDVYYQQNLTLDECYNHIHRVNKKPHVTFGADGTYFYVDDEQAKVRYLCLNTSDLLYKTSGGVMETGYNKMWSGAIRQTQMDFIKDALLTADGYAVVVASHIPLFRDGVHGADMSVYNNDILLGMLRAAKNKTTFSASSAVSVPGDYLVEVSCDFSKVNVDVVGCFAGHTHYDNATATDGINIVTTLNNSANVYDDSPAKTPGTATECAFDIVTVNTKSKTVNLTRIGAGKNRAFNY